LLKIDFNHFFFGDTKAANLWPTLLGKSANDGLIGLGGLTSALITSY